MTPRDCVTLTRDPEQIERFDVRYLEIGGEEAAAAQKVLAKINVTNLPLIVQKLGAAYGYQKSQFI